MAALATPFGNGAPAGDKQPESPPARRPRQGGWLAAAVRRLVRPQIDPKVDAAFVALAAVVYGVLYFSIGSNFLPGHSAWATLLLWASSQIGALVAWQLRLPRVIGMLCAGLLMRNIPWSAVDAFNPRWGVQMRAAALATIFLRCGLELDFGTMRRFKYPAMRLALLPGLVEAFYDGGVATALFNMPVLLAFTMGFILKAVGPGLVVPAMFQLQKTGLGKDQGIPSTVVIAASFDDVIAITGYSIFSSVAITGQGDVAWQIASGPLQVVFGILGGLIAGLILGCTRLFSTRNKRLVGIYGSALLLMFFLEYYNLLSGGALGALFVGLVASNAWEKGVPRFGSLGRSFVFSPEIERVMAVFWNWIWEPMLFVTIGWSIDFATLDTGIIPKSLIIICTGVCLRTIVTFLIMSGFSYTAREKLFYALAWTPKATVQAALSGAPLALILKYKCDGINPESPEASADCKEYAKWGDDILVTGVFAIIVCGTLGTLAIHLAAPILLSPAEEGSDSEAGESTVIAEPGDGAEDQVLPSPYEPGMPPAGPRRLPGSAARLASLGIGEGSAAGGVARRAGSTPNVTEQLEPAIADHELLAEFLDAIHLLTAAVHDDRMTKLDLVRLSDRVLETQRHVEAAMERREPSVRELFRTASRLARTFVMRAPHAHAQPLPHAPPAGVPAAVNMDRTRSGGSGASGAAGVGLRARQASIDRASTGRLQGREGLISGPGSINTWPAGSRPTTPDDPGV
ncbi:hypothetical protein COHA_000496 [Chlorella ohadii]|uniref:Cation/H+ exchanger transmembrane domain-containing protein n=1 Tax=Chlorella ohadii TaxID=2649997 RepID=A0AAD5DXR0_9CHLO|nr:hypothetical protein COHA_000496 [Chlorella ohadii]